MKNFKVTYLKLTLFYVAIIMFISVGFSVAIYNASSQELNRGLGRQASKLCDLTGQCLTPPQNMFEQIRSDQIEESNGHLRLELFYYNLLILVISTIGSYFFAKKSLEPIEKAMEAQNHFTADASHELRTPLTALRSEIEVALRDKNITLNESKKLLSSNLEEINKLESLSSALLKLAREQDNSTKKFHKVSLEEIIIDAYEKVAPLAEKKSIEFNNELADISVLGDRQSLTELFVILLDNAIKYSPDGSKIRIAIKQYNNKAIVHVADHGVGIKASDLPYIFNRFYRADSSRAKDKVDGFGLGLSIAKHIVELHHGTISVESRPGHGSEFTVKL